MDSEAGKGTTFRIFLPRHRPELEAAPEPQAANGAAKEAAAEPPKPQADLTGQGTILLVEDEDGLRSLNARGLRSRGYSVIEAANGVEAMEALEEKNGAVDLVVSDVVMPEMDGPTLLKEMRQRNPNLKIIFVSGYAEEAFDKSLPENEQFAFLAKAFCAQRAGREGEGDHDGVVTPIRPSVARFQDLLPGGSGPCSRAFGPESSRHHTFAVLNGVKVFRRAGPARR